MLVDTGSSLVVLPRVLADRLELRPTRVQRVRIGGSRVAVWPIAEVRIALDGDAIVTHCFITDDGRPILGAQALEAMFLGVDPVGQRLVPVEALA